jgi:DNA-binding LacI/PurR family transcriptional regulator
MPLISLLDRCLGEHAVFIQPDEVETGRMAADYLIRLGHVSMLHLTYVRESFAIESRACGFRERLKKQGLNPITVRGFEPETLLRKIRETRATAIFCHNDGMALRALRSLETAGIRVPDQIRIIGVDNSPSFTDIFPEITTFAYPFEWTASEAASIILDGKGTGTPCPPFRLVERRT